MATVSAMARTGRTGASGPVSFFSAVVVGCAIQHARSISAAPKMFDQVSRSLIASPFRPVDINAVVRRLKLIARAREDGAKELPPTD